MCGIAGIVNYENNMPVDKNTLVKMNNVMQHRGPDGEGIYIDKNVGLTHRRLSIIDLDKRSLQPMIDLDENIWVTFNGEIYDYIELRNELRGKGYIFRTNSDTEVIINAYKEYGPQMVNKFNGMFAFALYDKKEKTLFIYRDRFGVKPLYYTMQNGQLIFGSEIKALLQVNNIKTGIEEDGISSYLCYRYVIGSKTLFKNIYQLEPGCFLSIHGSSINKTRYWSLPIIGEKEDKGEQYYIDGIIELFYQAVRYRMRCDVPFGAYLSGGLDSSLIVAVMAELSAKPVNTYTIGFTEEGYNEFNYARLIADMYKTNHREIVLNVENYFDLMPKVIRYKDLPLAVPNEVPLYEMSRILKNDITVVLSGEGSDELFGGYGRIFRSPFDYERMEFTKDNKLLEGYDINSLSNNFDKKYKGKRFQSQLEHFLYCYNYLSLEDIKGILTHDIYEKIIESNYTIHYFENIFNTVKNLNMYDKYLWIFENMHLLGLLMRVDATTMATAVEARVPFVDFKLVEFVNSMPFKYKIKWRSKQHEYIASMLNSDEISEKFDIPKYILKEAFKDKLPQQIIERKKVGFPVPVHKWFGGGFNEFAKEILLDSKTRDKGIFNIKQLEMWLKDENKMKEHKFALKIWMLINFELWTREYF
jgi:asparagine synthase (glutamine-hydrolysing)